MNISITIDTEVDLHSPTYKSLEEGLPRLLEVLNKYQVRATFFVPAKLLEKFPEYFQDLEKQGHEIAIHGYEHERFDDLSQEEREIRTKKSVKIYKKIFNKTPKGFRAPQHAINEETLKILKKNNFLYDASYAPWNLLQLLFFPKKFNLWLQGFFVSRKIKELEKDFYEIPSSAFAIPFVSLPLRMFPWPVLKIYLQILKFSQSNLVFYAHSWDFIELPESKIDRTFSYKKLISNLEKTVSYLSKKNKFVKMEDLI